jgi:predicted metal-dependent hydrolase
MKTETMVKLERGRALFNAGRYFEAHEVWEEAWLGEEDETRRLLQGLIQVTAGFHKAFQQRQPKGCVRLLEAGLDKLATAADDAGDLDLASFKRAVRSTLEEARSWERGQSEGLSPDRAPHLDVSKSVKSE